MNIIVLIYSQLLIMNINQHTPKLYSKLRGLYGVDWNTVNRGYSVPSRALNDISLYLFTKARQISSIKLSQKSCICGAIPTHFNSCFFYLMTARVAYYNTGNFRGNFMPSLLVPIQNLQFSTAFSYSKLAVEKELFRRGIAPVDCIPCRKPLVSNISWNRPDTFNTRHFIDEKDSDVSFLTNTALCRCRRIQYDPPGPPILGKRSHLTLEFRSVYLSWGVTTFTQSHAPLSRAQK